MTVNRKIGVTVTAQTSTSLKVPLNQACVIAFTGILSYLSLAAIHRRTAKWWRITVVTSGYVNSMPYEQQTVKLVQTRTNN